MKCITLAMIVRDEEVDLPVCLSSVRDLVDDIVVVDTGSSDLTLEIAKKYHARIFSIKWKNNFSEPRNLALEKVRTDWVLHLDADEYLTPESRQKIKALSSRQADVYKLDLIEENGEFLFSYPRLFKKTKVNGYRGRIHENPIYVYGAKIESVGISIIHTGYSRSSIDQKNKAERNYRLISDALKEFPTDPFYNYLFARELDRLGEEGAIERYEIAFRLDTSVLGPDFFSHYITALAKKGHYEEALRIIERGLLKFDTSAELYFLKGLISTDLSLLDNALNSLNRSLTLINSERAGNVTPNMVWRGIGLVHDKKKDKIAAIKAFSIALQFEPDDKYSQQEIIRIRGAKD